MSMLKIFRRPRRKKSAAIAKERLKIIVSHERISAQNEQFNFLPKLQEELLEVIGRYVHIDREQVKVDLDHEGNNAVLELNITLPDSTSNKVEV